MHEQRLNAFGVHVATHKTIATESMVCCNKKVANVL